ncbi:hypothetical protein H2198_003023 [Neophaeococcomyces mojaviensis]|uniref:Uncharacterized protein n=1 Tax=Neophaeococcomyces mojaviensis TaxID=3383035 RepID=A0ACC3ACH2_9EURO|nr:hypothetical protein H2198_003023 [Knufia sp. JES_112]
MRATSSTGLKITGFQLDLIFALACETQKISERLVGGCHICDCEPVSEQLYLLDVPSPENVSYPLGPTRGDRNLELRSWTFSSQSHTDPSTRRARASSWSWKGKDGCSRSLHGAVPLRHPDEAFYIACRAEGQARSRWHKYRFDNHFDGIRWWTLTPKVDDKLTEIDFKNHMVQLNEEMTALSTDGKLSKCSIHSTPLPTAPSSTSNLTVDPATVRACQAPSVQHAQKWRSKSATAAQKSTLSSTELSGNFDNFSSITPVKSRRLNHDDYTIAWIAVLPIEAEAALGMLDRKHDGYFEMVRGDDYIYIGGEINGHNVVIATWPAGQNCGVCAAAALVNQVKSRFSKIWFALLVGVAAGLPNLTSDNPHRRRDIRLGDVLVCVPDKASGGIVHYDLGRYTEDGFLLNGRQAESPAIIRSAISHIDLTKKKPYKQGNEFARILATFQESQEDSVFACPSQESDQLYMYYADPTLAPKPVVREPRDESERTRVWFGNIGSGNSLMRNPRRRDELRDMYDLIGLEMEAAGVMNTLPTGVVRGVCDYGDGYKTKEWQPYAAAVAAVYARGILCCINLRALPKQSV